MAHGANLIGDIAVVTSVAAATAMLARRLGQPSILGYLLAGLIVGPYIPIPLFADPARMTSLAEVGVVLVMFAVGLEFRLRRLAEILPLSGLTAIVQIGGLAIVGHTVGTLLGWSSAASFTLGGALAVSSTMVVSAVLRARPVDEDVRAHVFGVLVIQDLVAIVLMAIVTTLASGGTLGIDSLGRLVGELSGAVLGMLVVGLLVLPRLVRLVLARFDSEVLVVLVVGAAFGLASVAELFGYSVALGAFIAGMTVAESGRSEQVEHAIESLRSLFAAIFFVSIGMTVDPRMALQTMPLALGLTVAVVASQFIFVAGASLLSGISLRRSVFSGLALGQIGELSFILATIGIEGDVVPAETLPALVTVATLTAFTTPLLLGRGQAIVDMLDRRIPDRAQHLLATYQSFLRRGREGRDERPLRRAIAAVLLDWMALVLVLVFYQWIRSHLDADHLTLLSVATAVLVAPFLVGLVRSGRRFLRLMRDLVRADEPVPAPRSRAVEAVVLLAVILAIGVPTVAVTQPLFAGPWMQGILLVLLIAVLVVVGLRFRAVRSGYTSAVAELAIGLSEQIKADGSEIEAARGFDAISGLDYQTARVEQGSTADGATLAELNIRCRTGATVIAIRRGDESTAFPTGHESLRAGDLLALSGSSDAQMRARDFFAKRDSEPPTMP